LILTGVTCAVHPSVNTFFNFIFTFSELKISKFGNVNTTTLRAQLIFIFFQTQFLAICLNFQQQNPLKNQYLPHFSSENYEINSIKSDLLKAFPITPRKKCPQIGIQFLVSILFNFHWIITRFHIVAPHFLKPSQ
jgi:hypothetical protein